jgi:hypothetical protein
MSDCVPCTPKRLLAAACVKAGFVTSVTASWRSAVCESLPTIATQDPCRWFVPNRRAAMMTMRAMGFLFFATIASSQHALAACGNTQSYLSRAQVVLLLAGKYACGKSTATNPPGWNERHLVGGSLVEQHEGGATVETVGTWSTSQVSSRGRVTYSYSGGVAPVYEIATVANGNCNPNCVVANQTYQFCGVGGGAPAVLNVYVSNDFQAPTGPPWVMNSNCPGNP